MSPTEIRPLRPIRPTNLLLSQAHLILVCVANSLWNSPLVIRINVGSKLFVRALAGVSCFHNARESHNSDTCALLCQYGLIRTRGPVASILSEEIAGMPLPQAVWCCLGRAKVLLTASSRCPRTYVHLSGRCHQSDQESISSEPKCRTLPVCKGKLRAWCR